METIRRAEAIWEGDLLNGRGTVAAMSSGAFKGQPVTWAARTEAPGGKTSPEELLAAAHASCFAMALSAGLARARTPARRLRVSAAVSFGKTEQGFRVTASALEVSGDVKGLDAAGFEKAAEEAKDGCPISQALKGNVALTVRATLE
ncbi:MAG: OsmC family peroxiredoxin [Planctomycetota bacterium]